MKFDENECLITMIKDLICIESLGATVKIRNNPGENTLIDFKKRLIVTYTATEIIHVMHYSMAAQITINKGTIG